MSRNPVNSGLYDDSVIDDRNARPLAIAFATIATMWLLVFGLVFVSTQLTVQPHQMGESAAPLRDVDRQVTAGRGRQLTAVAMSYRAGRFIPGPEPRRPTAGAVGV